MAFPSLSLPIIGAYGLKVQLVILALFLLVSYFHRTSRISLSCVVSALAGYKILVPIGVWIFGWGFWLLKTIAMFGFYIHFFQIGIGYLAGVANWVLDEIMGVISVLKEFERKKSQQHNAHTSENAS